eukprot:1916858-Prymnesium_polylepis.1
MATAAFRELMAERRRKRSLGVFGVRGESIELDEPKRDALSPGSRCCRMRSTTSERAAAIWFSDPSGSKGAGIVRICGMHLCSVVAMWLKEIICRSSHSPTRSAVAGEHRWRFASRCSSCLLYTSPSPRDAHES